MKKQIHTIIVALLCTASLKADTLIVSGGTNVTVTTNTQIVGGSTNTLITTNAETITITRAYQAGMYRRSTNVDLSQTPYSNVPTALVVWLASQCASNENLGEVVIESSGNVITTNADSTLCTNPILTAGCTILAPTGQRQTNILSTSLPSNPAVTPGDLMDGLLGAWSYITTLP